MATPFSALHLGNFKAFGETQRIPIKPITLLFGPNSAGKSSVLHGLLFAHEANRAGALDIRKTELGGDAVDLGGWPAYCYRHRGTTLVEFGADLQRSPSSTPKATSQPSTLLGVRLHLGNSMDVFPTDGPVRGRLGVGPYEPRLEILELYLAGIPLLKASRRVDGNLRIDTLNTQNPYLMEKVQALLELATTTAALSAEDAASLLPVIDALVPRLSLVPGKLCPIDILVDQQPATPTDQAPLVPIRRESREKDLAGAVELFLPSILRDLIRETASALDAALAQAQYLGPLRVYPPRHLAFLDEQNSDWKAGGGQAWERLKSEVSLRNQVNSWLGSKDRLQTPYILQVRPLIFADTVANAIEGQIGDFRHMLFDEATMKYLPDRLPADYEPPVPPWIEPEEPETSFAKRAKERQQDVPVDEPSPEELLENLMIRWGSDEEVAKLIYPYADDIALDPSTPRELILVDQRTNTPVSHRDVGIGISQVLPVLVMAYGSKNQILAMEQPEIHLHPALQAELADVFIESALGENKNTLLLETHSEHVILRILRRIRETTAGELPEGVRGLKPEDVAVVYAKPDPAGTKLIELRITGEGEFEDKWPDGFFTERAKELF